MSASLATARAHSTVAPPGTGAEWTQRLADAYYARLPRPLRRWLDPVAEPAWARLRRLAALLGDLAPRLYRCSPLGNPQGPSFLVASRGLACDYFLRRLFGREPTASAAGRLPLWRIGRRVAAGVDGILIEVDRMWGPLLKRRGFLPIPEWVHFSLDLSPPLEELLAGWRRRQTENLRRIRRAGFASELTHDRERLRSFYEQMYLPYVVSRYGRFALLASLAHMERLLEDGALLLVRANGEDVIGGLIARTSRGPLLAFLGVRDARREHIQRGGLAALYLFVSLWAKREGYREVDFGHTRPFLDDGVLRHKARWGMRLGRSTSKHRQLYLGLCRVGPQLRRLFAGTPLVWDDGGRLSGLLLRGEPGAPADQAAAAAHLPLGLDGLEVAPLERLLLPGSRGVAAPSGATARVIPPRARWYRRLEELRSLGPRGAASWMRKVARAAAGWDEDSPLTVSIEVTDRCNLACPSCPQPGLPWRKELMDTALVERILDDCTRFPELTSIVFTGFGEPLLHPQLAAMTRMAKARRFAVVRTYTNGRGLTPARIEDILTQSGLDELTISLNGDDPETYRRITGNEDYEGLVRNVERLLRRKRELGTRRPFVNLQVLALRGVETDFAAFVRRWRPLLGSGDCIVIKPSHDFAAQVSEPVFGSLADGNERRPCGQLWSHLHVSRAGEVTPCCVDPYIRLRLGSVHDAPLAALWRSRRLRELREAHLRGEADRVPLCGQCETWRYFPGRSRRP